jgi:tetratricopeptide (TPR) repeat protein
MRPAGPGTLRWSAVLLGLLAANALAASTGRLRITVGDADGRPLAGVKVLATVPATGFRSEAGTDARGEGQFPGLPGGEVIVRFEKAGFQTLEKNALITVGDTATIAVKLVPLPSAAVREPSPEEQATRRATDLYNEAARRYDAGDLDAASAGVEQALAARPDLAPALALKGRVAAKRGQDAAAIEAWIRAFEIDHALGAEVLPPLVVELRKAGRGEEAGKYARLLEQAGAPGADPRDLYNRAVIRINAGDDDGALDLLERALASKPDYAPALYQRGMIRLRAGRQAEALADLRRALEIDPKGAFAEDARALITALGG